jgi:iron complex transport system permease protein
MGGVDGVNFTLAAMMTIPLLLFFAVAAVFMPQLDLLLTGDSIAHSRGVNIQRSRIMFITMTAFAIGSIVAVCGPIGFVGIIAPHVCRLILPGIRHRILAACSFLLGGSILVFADTLARSIAPPTEIPVGIITSLLGGPFFLVILFRMKNRLWM